MRALEISLILLASVSVATLGCSSAGSSDEDTAAGALEAAPASPTSKPLKTLADAETVLLFADDAQRKIERSNSAFEVVVLVIDIDQAPFDAQEVPVAFCPSTHGARFLDKNGKTFASLALPCGEAPSRTNRVVVQIGSEKLGITVDGSTLAAMARARN